MSLYRGPEEHAANPPETWEVVKGGRSWSLRDRAGAVLETFTTKREAELGRADGRAANLYERERRWYAGENIAGWKPYAEVSR